jgi:hypothetical protein
MRLVCVYASGPAREAERLRAGLRGQWRQAARGVMVLLALLELRPATVRRHLGVPQGRSGRVLGKKGHPHEARRPVARTSADVHGG